MTIGNRNISGAIDPEGWEALASGLQLQHGVLRRVITFKDLLEAGGGGLEEDLGSFRKSRCFCVDVSQRLIFTLCE